MQQPSPIRSEMHIDIKQAIHPFHFAKSVRGRRHPAYSMKNLYHSPKPDGFDSLGRINIERIG